MTLRLNNVEQRDRSDLECFFLVCEMDYRSWKLWKVQDVLLAFASIPHLWGSQCSIPLEARFPGVDPPQQHPER